MDVNFHQAQVVWVVQDIRESADEISSFLEQEFGDKIRVVRVVSKKIFPVPDPRDLYGEDQGIVPDILVSELISTENLMHWRPQNVFEQIVGGALDDRFGNIARLAYFAKQHGINHVAVVSRCFGWFLHHSEVAESDADFWGQHIIRKLAEHGITAHIHKNRWTTEKGLLKEFVAKALES